MNNIEEFAPQNEIIEPDKESKLDNDLFDYLNKLWSSNNNWINEPNNVKPNTSEIPNTSLETFKKNIESKYSDLKVVGNFNYTNKLEKEVRLNKTDIKAKELKNTYSAMKDLINHSKINNELLEKINKVFIFEKVKDDKKPKDDLKNYRFIQVHSKELKLIDRLWCLRVVLSVKSLDTNIFKACLIRGFTESTVIVADENTKSKDNVILIDIEKAFDSCEYDVIEELLRASLKRKIPEKIANILTDQYIFILKNRNIYFKNKKVNYKKGLPTGFPSSNVVFSLIMDEIIYKWRTENKDLFEVDKDFKLNIYIDDIYIKLKNQDIKDLAIFSLISLIEKYKFKINLNKCKADPKLNLDLFSELTEENMYLGIPFTRDVKKYSKIILDKFNKDENYRNIHAKLISNSPENKQIFGYFNYKLKPMMKDENVTEFIEKYLI